MLGFKSNHSNHSNQIIQIKSNDFKLLDIDGSNAGYCSVSGDVSSQVSISHSLSELTLDGTESKCTATIPCECAFSWKSNCFICVDKVLCVKFRKFLKHSGVDKYGVVYNKIIRFCKIRNDALANKVLERVITVDLYAIGARYHNMCLSSFIHISDKLHRKVTNYELAGIKTQEDSVSGVVTDIVLKSETTGVEQSFLKTYHDLVY